MAFATFYDLSSMTEPPTSSSHTSSKPVDAFDLCYRHKTSILTRLKFVFKGSDSSYEPQFDVTLYPNSLFLMSLDANRLYTHEISPSSLPIDKIPIRLGYVIRCSKTKAVWRDGRTFIVDDNGELKALEPMTPDESARIKELYRQENLTIDRIAYPMFYTSLNNGDYRKPLL
jgi:hypothetical protein